MSLNVCHPPCHIVLYSKNIINSRVKIRFDPDKLQQKIYQWFIIVSGVCVTGLIFKMASKMAAKSLKSFNLFLNPAPSSNCMLDLFSRFIVIFMDQTTCFRTRMVTFD